MAIVVTAEAETRTQYFAVPDAPSSDLRPVAAASAVARVVVAQSFGTLY